MSYKAKLVAIVLVAILSCLSIAEEKPSPLKALIVTGQCTRPHDWKTSSVILKQCLEETHLFKVDTTISPPEGNDMSGFRPRFADYNVVVLDYKGDDWPEQTKNDFVQYVENGGGVVVYHGACWGFEGWDEFNKIIGLRWGSDEKVGPYICWRDGEVVRDYSPGLAGEELRGREFIIDVRNREHPIMKGLPQKWMHVAEGFYTRLRGPAENLTVLATAYADPNWPVLFKRPPSNRECGSGEHEPVLFTVNYGKGRVFHTILGHVYRGKMNRRKVSAISTVDFIVTFQRGAEWAATGNVTQKVPADFPTATQVSRRELITQTGEKLNK
jgi:type 1 glutamine amidotransferase